MVNNLNLLKLLINSELDFIIHDREDIRAKTILEFVVAKVCNPISAVVEGN